MWKHIFTFFDKLEDHVRFHLSHYPIIYALIGAIGITLVWKGVWETAEYFPVLFGPISFVLGVIILLITGLLVSFFIGDSFIISGLKREKKIIEKTETEVRSEKDILESIETKVAQLEQDLHTSKEDIGSESTPRQPHLPSSENR